MQTNDYSILSAREAQLVDLARAGQADELIEYLYTHILPFQAHRLVERFRLVGVQLDVEDLEMVGVEWALRTLDKALTMSRPVPWLCSVAVTQMLRYCKENASLVRVPVCMQYKAKRPPVVLSLDAPLRGQEDLTLADVLESSTV